LLTRDFSESRDRGLAVLLLIQFVYEKCDLGGGWFGRGNGGRGGEEGFEANPFNYIVAKF